MIYLFRAVIACGFVLGVAQETGFRAEFPWGTIGKVRSEISTQHAQERLRQLLETGLDRLSHNLAARKGPNPTPE